MSAATPGSTEIGRVLGYHGDGLLDIFLGLVLLDAWTIVRGGAGASSGGAIVILFPLLLVAKRAFTVPRLPSGWAEPPPPSNGLHSRTLLLLVVAAVALVALAVSVLPPSAHGGVGRLWQALALVGLGCVAAAGLRLGARRFVFYAGLTAVALLFTRHGPPGFGAYLTPALSAGMIVWGGVLLARFLAARARAA